MSEQSGESTVTNATQPEPAIKAQAEYSLARLMSEAAQSAPAPDIERAAIAAAEMALADSQRVLDAAEQEIATSPAPRSLLNRPSPARELALRILLGINLAAMIVVVFLPAPSPVAAPENFASDGQSFVAPNPATTVIAAPAPVIRTPSLEDPVIRAFAAADAHDYRTATRLLEEHLLATPRLEPSRKANILLALQHYCAQVGDFAKSQEYQRKVESLRNSHSMPEDLLAMASEAEQAGDIESMRRQYARLLLQQRQVPSSLYRHIAEAYLKLGDSYRIEAETAAQAARREELEAVRLKLRAQALQSEASRPTSNEGHK
ncbi:MAG: hypothetical protein NT107_10925 [Planctomycetota bacterium]|nr:hypothetical protein [Planctomycetota bacterium]